MTCGFAYPSEAVAVVRADVPGRVVLDEIRAQRNRVSEYKRFVVDDVPYETHLIRMLGKRTPKPRPVSPRIDSAAETAVDRATAVKSPGDQRRRLVSWSLWR
jgi:hypothetical protein